MEETRRRDRDKKRKKGKGVAEPPVPEGEEKKKTERKCAGRIASCGARMAATCGSVGAGAAHRTKHTVEFKVR